MTRYATIPLTLAMAAGLAGCQTMPDDDAAWATPAQGLLLARNSCSSCHGVGRNDTSANEDAPEFTEIAERGMTEDALASWLVNGHNYPADMGFTLRDRQAKALAAYIVTLAPGD